MSIATRLRWPINKLVALNNYPVVCQTKHFTLVGFGVFAAAEAFTVLVFLYVYIVASGYQLAHIPIYALPLLVACVWLGARAFHWWALGKKFFLKPKKYVHETGFYLQGGLFGGIISILFFAPFSYIPLSVLADGLALGVLLGQFIGRLGCYNYGCCFGKPTQSALGVCYSHPASKVGRWRHHWLNVRLHPTQLYMSAQNLVGFVVLLFLCMYQPLTQGLVFFSVMLWEGLARLMVEPMRADMSFSEGRNWRTVQVATSLALVGAIGVFWLLKGDVAASHIVFDGAAQAAFAQWHSAPHLWWVSIVCLLFIFLGYGVHGHKIGTFPLWSKVWLELTSQVRKRLTILGKDTHV